MCYSFEVGRGFVERKEGWGECSKRGGVREGLAAGRIVYYIWFSGYRVGLVFSLR